MTLQRATPRDALTGEPIRRDTIKRHLPPDEREDNRPTRVQRTSGWQSDLTARPLRLHTQQVEEGGLGGHVYSRDMARYLESGLRAQRTDERAQVSVWWRSAYGRGRVHAALVARYGGERGGLAYTAALAYASGTYDVDTIARETGLSIGRIVRYATLAREAAR